MLRSELRQDKMSTTQVAEVAAEARWANHREFKDKYQVDWVAMDYPAALDLLALLREQVREGSLILQKRAPAIDSHVKCEICFNLVKKWVFSHTIRDEETGLLEQRFICTPRCHELYYKNVRGSQFGVPK